MKDQAQVIRSINFDSDDEEIATVNFAQPSQLDFLYANVFNTADGQKVLEHLKSVTIDQPSWFPGDDPSFGYSREGQNSIVREIINRLRRCKNA
tara:strand:- start:16625 stop:16906 length:282 start_codon:yes stop_codon:yes gene_type:complete